MRVITFGIGFVSATVLLGAAVALTLVYMPSIQIVLMWIIRILTILFGLNLFGVVNLPVQTKPLVKNLDGKLAFTMLVMLQNLEFILPLLMFCLGTIIPFVAIRGLAGCASRLARSTYKHRSKIRAISGLTLIVYALCLIIFYLL